MFRGMRLDADGKQLRHILRAGMEVSKSHHFCMIPYQGKTYPPGTKAIYSALDPQNAVSFAIKTDDDLDKKTVPAGGISFKTNRLGDIRRRTARYPLLLDLPRQRAIAN